MPSRVYPRFKQGGLGDLIAGDTDVRVLVVTNGYVYSPLHEFLSSVPSGTRMSTSAPLTERTFANHVFDADDLVIPDVVGDEVGALILYVDTGNEATSRLFAYIDEGDGLTPIGADLNVVWNSAGIVRVGGVPYPPDLVPVEPTLIYGGAQIFNAVNDTLIAEVTNGGTYAVGGNNINVVAYPTPNITPQPLSVRFTLNNDAPRIESNRPWALFGDTGGKLNSGSLANGAHRLKLEFFSAASGGGSILGTYVYDFTVTQGQVEEPPPPQPTPSGTWPSGWDDPRFANATTSGETTWNNDPNVSILADDRTVIHTGPILGARNITARRIRGKCQEGVRISGPNHLYEDIYIECGADPPAHADGVQSYIGTPGQKDTPNIVFRRTKIIMVYGPGGQNSNTAAMFYSDAAGCHLTLEDCYLDGTISGHGALSVVASSGNLGCKSMSLSNVVIKGGNGIIMYGVATAANPKLISIPRWENVRWDNGKQIPHPHTWTAYTGLHMTAVPFR